MGNLRNWTDARGAAMCSHDLVWTTEALSDPRIWRFSGQSGLLTSHSAAERSWWSPRWSTG